MINERWPHSSVPASGAYRLTGNVAALAFNFMGGFSYTGAERLPGRAQPYILAPTHRSMLDIPALGLAMLEAADREVHFLAKQELFKPGLIGSFLSACGAFPVDRDEKGPKMKVPLEHLQNVLRDRGVVGIFPEGTRKNGQEVSRFDLYDGVAWLAMKEQAAIVPVGIAGTEKGKTGPAHVAFGETITPLDIAELDSTLPYVKHRKAIRSSIMDVVYNGMQTAFDEANQARTKAVNEFSASPPQAITI